MTLGRYRIDGDEFSVWAAGAGYGLLSNSVHAMGVEDSATALIGYAGECMVVDVRWNSRVARDQFRVIGTEGDEPRSFRWTWVAGFGAWAGSGGSLPTAEKCTLRWWGILWRQCWMGRSGLSD